MQIQTISTAKMYSALEIARMLTCRALAAFGVMGINQTVFTEDIGYKLYRRDLM